MPLFKERFNAEPRAYVRYADFKERQIERQTLFSSPKLQRKFISGPSGHQFQFRQQGRPTNSHSQWLPIRDERDVEHFEERDGFEVRRDRE